ncbi:MAG TPA: D-aminoacyl-tRNA deacylase [Candidatus Aquilonibacter sp.]
MRAVVQRVTRASVTVDGNITGAIDQDLMVLLAVATRDTESDAKHIAEKIAHLRIFTDDAGLMNRSVIDAGGAILLVSQFTLYGDARKGRRPSFIDAAREPLASDLYERTGKELGALGLHVAYGIFGADMQVELINDGPVTILLDSERHF